MNTPKADILVIDDTPENLHLLSDMLTQQGYKVRSVTKGATGVRGAIAAPPDLVLLDVNMPQMNGYEVCQQLKESDRTQAIPIIFISALGDVLDKVKAFSVGGVDYITKPFQVEEVLARIETHLTICRLQKQLQSRNQQLQQEMQERHQAEEKFTKAFRASPSPVAITTLSDNRFVEVNPSFVTLSGYNREDILGQTPASLGLGFRSAAYEQAVQTLLTTGSFCNQEFEFYTQGDRCRTVLLSLDRINLTGTPCILQIINDITERKRLENEFIALVSHELRTPMSSIIGALDILSTGQLGELQEQGKQVLKMATTNTERLMRLVNDILDLERMKSGKINMHKSHCQIAELLAQAAEAMQAMAQKSQVSLVINTVAAQIWADPDRILQTLTNLLSNAIKFSKPGGTVWLEAQSLTCSQLLITVRDEGRGIPEDKLQSIFERFQQVDASDSRQKGGTGLGLAICRNIIEQHDGRIWAERAAGAGSVFKVSLPSAIAQPQSG
ncbi:hybrid sensor histidine kinase/response regulator [Sphaerothrix gracilis]|uniref:hybrid sensor histidine kinase/response regulator n=1 Tax=Sphaerothrix gracilis TaxID=3151835 RepID=UPI0031FD25C1